MMKRLFAVWHARNLEFVRDRSTLLFTLVVPIALVVGMSIVFGGPERPLFKVTRRAGSDATVLNKTEVDIILAALDQAFAVHRVKGDLRIIDPRDNAQIGAINVGKTRISLRRFEIAEIEGIFVEPVNPATTGETGEEDSGVSLKRYIDQNDLFTISVQRFFDHLS